MSESKDEKNIHGAETSVLPVEAVDTEHGASRIERHKVALADADEAAAFVAGFQGEITQEQADRVRRKIDWHILPLM
jgi:hypothetical protein